jgi:hypothetical protein
MGWLNYTKRDIAVSGTTTSTSTSTSTTTTTSTTSPVSTTAPPNYVVYKSGSTYYADLLTHGGTNYYSNANFHTLFNYLSSNIAESKRIYIENGAYTATGQMVWAKNNTYIYGQTQTGTVITTPSSGSTIPMLIMAGGSQNGTSPVNVIFEYLTIDGNDNTDDQSFIEYAGNGTIFRNCTARHTYQYGLGGVKATNFSVLYCTADRAQYCISVGANSSLPFAENGELAYNTVLDGRDCGFKIKFADTMNIHDNDVDAGYTTWLEREPGSPYGAVGIRLYNADGPVISATVNNNHIHDSAVARNDTQRIKENWGMGIDAQTYGDAPEMVGVIISEDNIFTNNTVEQVFVGAYIAVGGTLVGVDRSGNPAGNIFKNIRNAGIEISSNSSTTSIPVVVKYNDFRNIGTGITTITDSSGTATINSNLFHTTASGRRSLTTSSNEGTGAATLQGFTMSHDEVIYTESNGTIKIGAAPVSGKTLSKFTIDGVDRSPVGGFYTLSVGTSNHTIVVVYV